jgi:predicted Zn-dependent protease
MSMIESFETMLAQGQDNPLLRFSLGNAYLKAGVIDKATMHLRVAVMQDGNYSAAWKLLGKALSQTSDVVGAKEAYLHGIAAANAKGDKQTAKEIGVFLRRLG